MNKIDFIKAIIVMIIIFIVINYFLGDGGLSKFNYKIF